MPAGGDCIELVHEQNLMGQSVNNVYYFEAVTASASLIDLASWFETNVTDRVKAFQLDLVIHENLRLRNLFNDSETYEEPLSGNGDIASSTNELPSFMAYTIRLDHDNGAVRPGFKRYAGVGEAGITDALVTLAVTAQLENLILNLVNPPVTANPDWVHVVVNRVCETPNPTPGAIPRCLKYRLPESQAEYTPGYIQTGASYSQPTTQNSRKWYT